MEDVAEKMMSNFSANLPMEAASPLKVHVAQYCLPYKKNAYALKTPRVVAPTFILWCRLYYCVSLTEKLRQDHWFLHRQCLCAGVFITMKPHWSIKLHQAKTPVKHFLTLWPWPLTYDLDLWTWPRYPSTWPTHQKSGSYVCPFSRESGNRHTDTQTHDVKTITPVAYVGCKYAPL